MTKHSNNAKNEQSDLHGSKSRLKWQKFLKWILSVVNPFTKERLKWILSVLVIQILIGFLVVIIYTYNEGPQAYKIYIVGDFSTNSMKRAKNVSTKASQVKEGFENFNNGRKPLKFEGIPIELEWKHVKDIEDSDKIASELADLPTTLAVIGHFKSTLTKRAIQTYMSVKPPIPMFLPTETSTELLSDPLEGDYYPIYRLVPNDEYQVEAVIELALKYGNQKFWIVHDNENEVYSSYLTKRINKKLLYKGKSVVRQCSLQQQDSLSVKNDKPNNHYEKLRPDCVIFIGNSANALVLINQIKYLEDGRPMPTFILTDSAIEPGFGQHGGYNLDGVFVTHPIPSENFQKSGYTEIGYDINMIVTTLVREGQELWRRDSWFWERMLNKVKLNRFISARKYLVQAMKLRSERRKSFNDGKLYDKYTFDYYGNNENAKFSKWIIDKSHYRDIGKIEHDTMRESAIKLLWPIRDVSTERQSYIFGEKACVEWRGLEDVIGKNEYIVQWKWGGNDEWGYDEIHRIFLISDQTIKSLKSDQLWKQLKSSGIIKENDELPLENLKNIVYTNEDDFIKEIKKQLIVIHLTTL